MDDKAGMGRSELDSYQAELVQVAAVAVAMLHDDFMGDTNLGGQEVMNEIGRMIAVERRSQERKWGPQHHSKEKWLAILTEEVGEVARDILENPAG